MFANTKVLSSFSVDDVDAARRFYGQTLGLRMSDVDEMGTFMLEPHAGGPMLVYGKSAHTPASFTILNFFVDDIDAAVDALTARGVSFERYAGFEQDDKGIARPPAGGGPPIAWFTDPAGNILAVLEQPDSA